MTQRSRDWLVSPFTNPPMSHYIPTKNWFWNKFLNSKIAKIEAKKQPNFKQEPSNVMKFFFSEFQAKVAKCKSSYL